MQPRPVGGKARRRQPDHRDRPAIRLWQPLDRLAHQPGGEPEQHQKQPLPPDPLPIEQDQCQHTPDCDIVKAGIAQQPVTQRLAKDAELFHQQHQNRQRRHRAGHADAQHRLAEAALQTDPARRLQQQCRSRSAEQQRHQQCSGGRGQGFAPIGPGIMQIQFQPGGKHEQHHRPPGNAVQRPDDLRIEHKGISAGIDRAQHTGAEQDAADNLHHHQRSIAIGASQPPDGIRHRQNDRQRDQENFAGAHACPRCLLRFMP